MSQSFGQDSLEVRVLAVIEELLKIRRPGDRNVDANMVLKRMQLGKETKDAVAQTMSDLREKGDVQGPPPLIGDNKVLDVVVKAITPQGVQRLYR